MLRFLQLMLVGSSAAVTACEHPTASSAVPESQTDSIQTPSVTVDAPRAFAFVSDRAGPPAIFLTNPGDSTVTFLVHGEAPAWSSDGSRIAFQRTVDTGGVYVAKMDGSQVNRIGAGVEPAWSPNDREIVFNGDGGLFVTNSDGFGTARKLLADGADLPRPPWYVGGGFGPGWVERPSWSPDGRHIAFVYAAPYGWDFDIEENAYVMNADGSDVHLLSGWCTISPPGQGVLPCPTTYPVWSPDGEFITVVTRDFNQTTGALDVVLASIGESGWDTRQIHYRGYKNYIGRPEWSPDGAYIIFDQPASQDIADSRPARIFMLTVATGVVRRLLPDAGNTDYVDVDAVWSRQQTAPSDSDPCNGCWDH